MTTTGGRDVTAEGNAPAIELIEISKRYASSDENVQAVEHIGLRIEGGEFF